MGIQDSFSDLFGSFSIETIIDKVYFYIGILFICILIGAIAFGIYFLKLRKQKKSETYKIGWWDETNYNLVPTRMDDAEEIVIPGTSLRVFYVKARDLWLPRFTKGITKDLFYVTLTPNRRMVNFILKSLSQTLRKQI